MPLSPRSGVVAVLLGACALSAAACVAPMASSSVTNVLAESIPPPEAEMADVSTTTTSALDASTSPTTSTSTTSTTTSTSTTSTTTTSTTVAPGVAVPGVERAVPDSVADMTAQQAGSPVLIEQGHLDLIEARVVGGRIELAVKDESRPGGAVFRNPADVQVRVKDRSRVSIPGDPAFGFLGAAGRQVYLLPQVQDANLVWPGWSTERISAGQVAGDAIQLRITRVDGPGTLVVFTTDQFGSPSVLVDSANGLPDQITVPIRTHAHANWAFSSPGVFRVGVEVSATAVGGAATSATAEYVFVVGDSTSPPTSRPTTTASTAPPTTRPGTTTPPTTRPGTGSTAPTSSPGSPSVPGASGSAATSGSAPSAAASVAGRTSTRAGTTSQASEQAPAAAGVGSAAAATTSLPNTGSTVAPIGLAGVLCLVIGCAFAWTSRRRSTPG